MLQLLNQLFTNPFVQIILAITFVFYLYYLIIIILLGMTPSTKTPKPLLSSDKRELWLVVPALNEESVIEQTIQQLTAELKKLPPQVTGKLLIVDDHSTDATYQLATNLTRTIQTSQTMMHSGKGEVLNTAVAYIRTQRDPTLTDRNVILGVIDADGQISAEDLEHVLASFTRVRKLDQLDYDMVQTAVRMKKVSNGLQRAQDFEFSELNRKQQLFRNFLGFGIASGNGQFVTLHLAKQVGWGNGLLEDLEFSLRTWLAGYKTCYTDQAVVYQEAVKHFMPYVRQRIRWCAGGLQCARYLPRLYQTAISPLQKIDLTVTILFPLLFTFVALGNLLALVLQIVALIDAGGVTISFGAIFGIWLVIALLMARGYQGYTAKHWLKKAAPNFLSAFTSALWFQWYCLAIAFIPWVALFKIITKKTAWVKTVHHKE